MGKISKDAKDLLVGNDGSDKEPNDFKVELQDAIKKGIVTKSDGTLLITSRMNSDKLGEKIIKNQEDGVKKINDKEVYDTAEEELEAEEKKKEKEREKERRRKERETQIARQLQEVGKNNDSKIEHQSEKDKEISEEKR